MKILNKAELKYLIIKRKYIKICDEIKSYNEVREYIAEKQQSDPPFVSQQVEK